MGSFDGAKTFELVGKYLSQLASKYGSKIGLCRPSSIQRTPQRNRELKKHIKCKTFIEKNEESIKLNNKCADYLCITLNLWSKSFMPYTKPNNTLQYEHCRSNIQEGINRRLSNISSDKESFNSASTSYQTLKKSGNDYQVNFNSTPLKPKHQRNRNVIWFKIFNRSTPKLCYSCMPNIGSVIPLHNKALPSTANRNRPPATKECNCHMKDTYPLVGKCLVKALVYHSTVTREDNIQEETSIGLTKNSFKSLHSNHVSSFRNANKKHMTELSKYIWHLKQCKPYSKNTEVIFMPACKVLENLPSGTEYTE